jgi:hypothetical protein
MSEKNGDKARFGRERKRKVYERKRIRELRRALENNSTRLTLAAPELVSITSLTLEPTS